jgi:hypothetical protein
VGLETQSTGSTGVGLALRRHGQPISARTSLKPEDVGVGPQLGLVWSLGPLGYPGNGVIPEIKYNRQIWNLGL